MSPVKSTKPIVKPVTAGRLHPATDTAPLDELAPSEITADPVTTNEASVGEGAAGESSGPIAIILPLDEQPRLVENQQTKRALIRAFYQAEKVRDLERSILPAPTSRPDMMGADANLELLERSMVEDNPHEPDSNQHLGEDAIVASLPAFGESDIAPLSALEVQVEQRSSLPTAAVAAVDETLLLDAYWADQGDAAIRALLRSRPEDESILEVVIGEDDRTQVIETQAYPWRCICSLLITAANNSRWIGTGWFVGPRLLLTAGHCVYMHEQGGWAKAITVIPGRHGTKKPYSEVVATIFHSVRGWTRQRRREFDYAAMILPEGERVGERTGWFGYTVNKDQALAGAEVNLAGYPKDKPTGTQWFHAKTIRHVSPQLLTYEIDTGGGQSGAPIWIAQSDGKRFGVGIHTNGSLTGNSATRISQEVFDNIERWKSLAI